MPVPEYYSFILSFVSIFSLLWTFFKLGNMKYKRKVCSVFSFDNPPTYSMFIYHWLESSKMYRIIWSLMWWENFVRDLWMQWHLKMNRTWVFVWLLLPSAGSPQALSSPSLSLGLLIPAEFLSTTSLTGIGIWPTTKIVFLCLSKWWTYRLVSTQICPFPLHHTGETCALILFWRWLRF